MEPYILIIEDEPGIVELLDYNLKAAGFETAVAHDGDEAELALSERTPDAVLLDWMLPGVSGIELCRRIRKRPETRSLPVIMLTARGEEADRVRGLDSGADDYVTKPFSPAEVIARLRAVLRRSRPATAENTLAYENVTLDQAAHKVERAGRRIHLGPTEYRLLSHFMERPGRVFTREQLLDAVWGQDIYVETRTVDVHIRRLRKALNGEGERDLIRTVRSAGYAMDMDAPG